MSILFNRALLLAKAEATFDTDVVPDATNDAFLVIEPDFAPDINSLVRPNVRTDLSQDAIVTGRKMAQLSFGHEVRNNGNLVGTLAPRLGRLIEACGFGATQVNEASECVETTTPATANTGDLEFIGTTAPAAAMTLPRELTITITTGGVSGAAFGSITSPAADVLTLVDMSGTDDVTFSDGVEILVVDAEGNTVIGITPSFQSNNPATNDVYTLLIRPLGYSYKPISAAFPSLTLYMYYPDDTGSSILHKITGARGTFTVDATGGDYAKFNFSFTGSYVAPADVSFPTATYETQTPQQVEQAYLYVEEGGSRNTSLKASSWTIDMGVEVVPREDVNASDAYAGAIIVGRQPSMGFDPEAVLEATHDFWNNMANATSLEWFARVGTSKGNLVFFKAPNLQYGSLGYGNRNSLRTYEVTGHLARTSGNDELEIYFA